MSDTPLYSRLKKYSTNTELRLHMPGHGGKCYDEMITELFKLDVTELVETDNLYCPSGVILEAERLCAEAFGSAESLFSCSGATLALQAAITTALKICGKAKPTVFCDRLCHRSISNAFSLLNIMPKWFFNEDLKEEQLSTCDILVITSCDYYGNIIDLKKLSEICKKHHIITVVDNSHGSHLAFFKKGILHPLKYDYSFVIDSVHKTLPVLTGGAILHIGKKFMNKHNDAKELCLSSMSLFGSSSPNYLIMASIDLARARLNDESKSGTSETLLKTKVLIDCLYKEFSGRFFSHKKPKNRDPFRVVINGQYNFKSMYEYLYNLGIKCEFYDDSSLVMIIPYGFDESDYNKLSRALNDYPERSYYESNQKRKITLPKQKMTLRAASLAPFETITIDEAFGRIASTPCSIYPPGIPQIMPGELFDKTVIKALKSQYEKVNVVKLNIYNR